MIIALGAVEVASAEIKINFTFTNFSETINTDPGKVTKDAGSYYVVLNSSSTVASNNVFGFRARNAETGAKISSYRTMDYVGKKTVSYSSSVKEDDRVYFKCKKDDSSTYGGPLNACGYFQP